jgi:hypothetical protein
MPGLGLGAHHAWYAMGIRALPCARRGATDPIRFLKKQKKQKQKKKNQLLWTRYLPHGAQK